MTSDPLATAPNFRDLGGWATRDGRRIRKGLIFRSEALLSPSEADVVAVRAKGIVLVCDLRSDSERTHGPNLFWERCGVERLGLDLLANIPPTSSPWSILREQPDPDGARDAMRRVYAAMAAASVRHIGTVLRRIAAGDVPLLIHCTAGKDRTGFVCAVLLLALGVDRGDVAADYMASLGRWTSTTREATRVMLEARLGWDPEPAVLDELMAVAEEYLDAGLSAIDADFGGLEAYLAEGGVDAVLLGRVRDRLLA